MVRKSWTLQQCRRMIASNFVHLQDIMDVAELAASALSMLTTRSDGRDRMRRCDAIASMVHAFKACMDDCVLEHLGSALGNLANHSAARQQMRDAGMVGMLTRVLRVSHRPRAQARSAPSLVTPLCSLLVMDQPVHRNSFRRCHNEFECSHTRQEQLVQLRSMALSQLSWHGARRWLRRWHLRSHLQRTGTYRTPPVI